MCEESLSVLKEVGRGEDQGAGYAHHVVQVDYLTQEQLNHLLVKRNQDGYICSALLVYLLQIFISVIIMKFLKEEQKGASHAADVLHRLKISIFFIYFIKN